MSEFLEGLKNLEDLIFLENIRIEFDDSLHSKAWILPYYGTTQLSLTNSESDTPLEPVYFTSNMDDKIYEFSAEHGVVKTNPDVGKLLHLFNTDYYTTVEDSDEFNEENVNALGITQDGIIEPLLLYNLDTQAAQGLVANGDFISPIDLKSRMLPQDIEIMDARLSELEDRKDRNQSLVLKRKKSVDILNPNEIKQYLDSKMVGQDKAKRMAALALSMLNSRKESARHSIAVPHMLLVGPSNSGKTMLVNQIQEISDIPVFFTELPNKSTAGYVNTPFETILEDVYDSTNARFPYAIVFIDEIDKTNTSFEKGNLDTMLTWMQGTQLTLYAKNKSGHKLDTRNIMFIAAGTFNRDGKNGLPQIISRRIQNSGNYGEQIETPAEREIYRHATSEDFIEYGLKPELFRRFKFVAPFDALSVPDAIQSTVMGNTSLMAGHIDYLNERGYKLVIEPGSMDYLLKGSAISDNPEVIAQEVNSALSPVLFEPHKYADDNNKITLNKPLIDRIKSNIEIDLSHLEENW